MWAAKAATLDHVSKLVTSRPVTATVLFSSLAALLGSPGQANYSAANAYLDAAAQKMSLQGLTALSVQWGAWAGAGMAARQVQTAMRATQAGLELLDSATGLAALEGLLSSQLGVKPLIATRSAWTTAAGSVVAAMPVHWDAFLKRFSAATAPPALFSELQESVVAATLSSSGREMDRETRLDRSVVRPMVDAAIAAVLGVSVPSDAPLLAAGLDSLGAVELKNSLETSLRMALPTTLVFDYPTTDSLVNFITSQAGPQ